MILNTCTLNYNWKWLQPQGIINARIPETFRKWGRTWRNSHGINQQKNCCLYLFFCMNYLNLPFCIHRNDATCIHCMYVYVYWKVQRLKYKRDNVSWRHLLRLLLPTKSVKIKNTLCYQYQYCNSRTSLIRSPMGLSWFDLNWGLP